MKRLIIVTSLVLSLLLAASFSSMAANQITLGVNGGWSYTWGELELEFKFDEFAFGAQVGLGTGVIEVGAFGRYYYQLNEHINLAPEYELSLFAELSPSLLIDFLPVELGFGIKVGPGIDFRWQHLRVMVQIGYGFETLGTPASHFFTKAGIGYRF